MKIQHILAVTAVAYFFFKSQEKKTSIDYMATPATTPPSGGSYDISAFLKPSASTPVITPAPQQITMVQAPVAVIPTSSQTVSSLSQTSYSPIQINR